MRKVRFLHPDLGIGGAERLVIDAALALKSKDLDVSLVTNHHDPEHSFPETNNGDLNVTVVFDWMPRRIFGHFYAFCAYIRMILAAVWLCITDRPDIIFCDQISACIPFIRCLRPSIKIIFYCHFPDMRLTKRDTIAKSLYRLPIDKWEEFSTGLAHCVLVNSQFTAGIFRETFKTLDTVPLKVLYPSLHTTFFDSEPKETPENLWPAETDIVFLSINRYERKKNVGLAIEAFNELGNILPSSEWERCHLIIAGGYDLSLPENREHFQELRVNSDRLGLSQRITFLKSPPDSVKLALLRKCVGLLYTPSEEHFGIVPIEAMYCGTPVIAVNNGGPTESIIQNQTGILVDPIPQEFAAAMKQLATDPEKAKQLGQNGRKNVIKRFSFEEFSNQLEKICSGL